MRILSGVVVDWVRIHCGLAADQMFISSGFACKKMQIKNRKNKIFLKNQIIIFVREIFFLNSMNN